MRQCVKYILCAGCVGRVPSRGTPCCAPPALRSFHVSTAVQRPIDLVEVVSAGPESLPKPGNEVDAGLTTNAKVAVADVTLRHTLGEAGFAIAIADLVSAEVCASTVVEGVPCPPLRSPPRRANAAPILLEQRVRMTSFAGIPFLECVSRVKKVGQAQVPVARD